MPYSANYQLPIIEALGVLEDSGIECFPVDLYSIQQQYKNLFQIRSFRTLMQDRGLSREECCRLLGSKDGAAVFDGCSKYIIYFNEQIRKQRIRFTIAHEIGHIILDHHLDYGKPILSREGIPQQLYRRLENEANCFARNLLSPAYHTKKLLDSHGVTRVARGNNGWEKTKETSVTKNLKTSFHADTLVGTAFDVSIAAAQTRVGLLNADITKYQKYQIDWESTSHIKQTAYWRCDNCGLERIQGIVYCSECGQEFFVFG